jgi:hypothetical protein
MKMVTDATNKHNKRLQATEAAITNYEEAFAKLKEVSGISDLNHLVDRYVSSEDEIFSLYNYVQSVNQDVAEWERKVSETVAAMNKHMRSEGHTKDKQNETLSKSRSRKEYLVAANDRCTETFARNEKDISLWCQVVQDLFSENRLLDRGSVQAVQSIADQKKVLMKEYEIRTGRKWAGAGDSFSDDEDPVDAFLRREQERGSKKKRRRGSPKTSPKGRGPRNAFGDARGGAGRSSGADDSRNLISSTNLLAALSIIQQASVYILAGYEMKVVQSQKGAPAVQPHIRPRKAVDARGLKIMPPTMEKEDDVIELDFGHGAQTLEPVDTKGYMETLRLKEKEEKEKALLSGSLSPKVRSDGSGVMSGGGTGTPSRSRKKGLGFRESASTKLPPINARPGRSTPTRR